jgi:hypothetical protein
VLGPALIILWVIQLVIVVMIALCDALRGQRALALGTIGGLVAGLAPLWIGLYMLGGLRMLGIAMLVGPISIFILAVVYAIGGRWIAATLAIGLLALLSAGLFGQAILTDKAWRTVQEWSFGVVILEPTLAVLALREVVRHFYSNRRPMGDQPQLGC